MVNVVEVHASSSIHVSQNKNVCVILNYFNFVLKVIKRIKLCPDQVAAILGGTVSKYNNNIP